MTILSFLGFSQNVFEQKLLVYHNLILIHMDVNLYSQRRENLKLWNSAPGLKIDKCKSNHLFFADLLRDIPLMKFLHTLLQIPNKITHISLASLFGT